MSSAGISTGTERYLLVGSISDTILENSLDAVIGADENNRVFFWNSRAVEIFGWSKTEAIGKDLTDLIVPERFRKGHRAGVKRFLKTGIPESQNRRLELFGLRRSGEEFPLELTVSSLATEKGYDFYSFLRDVSIERAAAAKLEKEKSTLALALEGAKMGTWTISYPDGIITGDERFLKMHGIPAGKKEENLGEAINRHAYPGDDEKILTELDKAINTKTPYICEYRCKVSEGIYRWIFARGEVNFSENGQPKSMSGISFDIHDRKLAELENIASKERLHNARMDYERSVDVSPAILWITERDGSCTYLSKQWYEFTGQTQKEALGFGWLDATHPDDKEKTAKIYVEANAKQKPFYAEYRLRTKNGQYRWAIDAGNPRYDKDGVYLGYAGTVFDIHERKLAAEETKDLQRRFERSAQATDLGVWYCDLPFDKLNWNDEVKRHFFLPPAANVTIDIFYERIHLDDREPTREAIQASIDSRSPYDTVYRTTDPLISERVKFIRAVGWADYDRDGKPIRFDGITLDVTRELSNNEELKLAKEAAEHANELKSVFLANMSHEIRTPLGAMLGFADLLRDPGVTNNERSNYVDILLRNGEQLSVIINDILDLSKVEAGHLTLEYTDFYPAKLAEEALSLLRVKAKDKGLVLEYKPESSMPGQIVSDPTRVRQVLLNLVSNAVKFTKHGSVTIKSYGCRTDSGKDAVCFEISDTGMGFPVEKRETIFEAFVQADGSMTRRFGGTGLGLALSRQLARALGGDVTVLKTELNVGTTFLFKVEDQPVKRNLQPEVLIEEQNKSGEYGTEALKGIHILVVDDAPDNQALLWRLLTKHGAVVDSAENGLLGYKKALSANHDIILMDIQMPEMDGYTATHKLRSAGYQNQL